MQSSQWKECNTGCGRGATHPGLASTPSACVRPARRGAVPAPLSPGKTHGRVRAALHELRRRGGHKEGPRRTSSLMPSSSAAWRAAATSGGASCCSDRPPGKLGGEQRVRSVCEARGHLGKHNSPPPNPAASARVRLSLVCCCTGRTTLPAATVRLPRLEAQTGRWGDLRVAVEVVGPATVRHLSAASSRRRVRAACVANQAEAGVSISACSPHACAPRAWRTVDVAEGH
jgi:hypothetical protein